MRNNKILFSVIVPCYNYGKYLEECIQSVINQTYKKYEIIIINDGSVDNTYEIATNLIGENTDTYIRLINQKNTGQPAISRNNGIKFSNGKYILCLDADDKISPNYLQDAYETFNSNKDISILFPNLKHFGDEETYIQFQNVDPQLVFHQNCYLVSSIFAKKVWDETGGYSTNVPGYEDWDFWVNAVSRGFQFKHLINSTLFYRKHGEGMYKIGSNRDQKNKANIILNNKKVYSETQINWAKNVILGKDELLLENQTGVIPIFDDCKNQYKNNHHLIENKIKINKIEKYKTNRLTNIHKPTYKKYTINNEVPLVTVILTTYNRRHHLIRSLGSVLNQQYPNIEIIVVNDGGYCVKDIINNIDNSHCVNYIELGTNHGLAGARNQGLRLSTGDYICFLDDDDYFENNHIELLISNIQKNNIDVLYSNSKRVYETYENNEFSVVKIIDPDPACLKYDFVNDQHFKSQLLIHNFMPVNTIIFSRLSFYNTGYFDETLTVHEDWDYWIRLSKKYQFYHLDITTCAVTERIDRMSVAQSRDFYFTMKRIHAKYISSLEEVNKLKKQILQNINNTHNTSENNPIVSIIIFSTNLTECQYLDESIHSILNNTKSVSFEIIIATNQRNDFNNLSEFTSAKLVTIFDSENDAFAINKAANIASGKYLVIMKPYVSTKLGWIKILLDEINKKNIKLVLGKTRYLKNNPVGLKYSQDKTEVIRSLGDSSKLIQHLTDDILLFSDIFILKAIDFKLNGGFENDKDFYLNLFKIFKNLNCGDNRAVQTVAETCVSNYFIHDKKLQLIQKEFHKYKKDLIVLSKFEEGLGLA